MQTPSDITLLQRWSEHRDAHAFKTIALRYGALVYGVANRVLKNRADAEEVTQECFFKLAMHPDQPARSVGPWLHSVAVNTSINRIRTEQRRRDREAKYEAARPPMTEYSASDLMEHVDEAIALLSEPQRQCVVATFIEGKTQEMVAADLGISRRSVRRRTDEAIACIRELLAQRGIATRAGTLALVLEAFKVEALPPGLGASLGKIAVGGEAHTGLANNWAVADRALQAGGTIIMKKTIVTVLGIGMLGLFFWWMAGQDAEEPVTVSDNAAVIATTPQPVVQDEPATSPPIPEQESEVSTAPAMPIPALMSVEAIPPIANPTRYAAVSGTVLDALSQPIPNATVTLAVSGASGEATRGVHAPGLPDVHPENSSDALARWRQKAVLLAIYSLPGHRYEVTTDDSGRYYIAGVRYRGSAQIAARAEGLEPRHQSLELVEDAVSEANFQLNAGGTIHGRIVASNGLPVADARVACFQWKYSNARSPAMNIPKALPRAESQKSEAKLRNHPAIGQASAPSTDAIFQARTDADGFFTLSLAGAETAGLIVESERRGTEVFRDVPVGGEEIVTLTWTSESGTMDGQILMADGEPAAGYLVFASGTIGETGPPDAVPPPPTPVEGSRFAVETDVEGRFHFEDMPVQEHYVVAVYDRAGKKRGVGTPPPLARDGRASWRFQLPPALVISGRVVGVPSGHPVSAAYVTAKPSSLEEINLMEATRVQTGPDGAFTLELMGEEEAFDVVASVHRALDSLWNLEHVQRVDFDEVTDAEITLEIPDPWRRRFRVVEPDSTPVAGAQIRVRQNSKAPEISYVDTTDLETDLDGYYTSQSFGIGVYTQFTFSRDGYIDGVSTLRTGEPGATAEEERIVLYPSASASARLLDTAGLPIAAVEVLCTARYGENQVVARKLATDAAGWLLLDDWLPAGAVTLALRLPDNSQGAYTTFGSNGPDRRSDTAVLESEAAAEAHTENIILENVALSRASILELGDLVLSAE